jgi:hypothetical protein
VNGFHVEGMAEHKLDAVIRTEIGDPVPGEHAFDAGDQIILVVGNQFE